MKKLQWNLKLSITPKLKESEEIDGFNFVCSDGKTYVDINFETSSFDKTLPSQLHEYEYAEQTLTRNYLETLRALFLKRLIFRKAFQPIEIIIEKGPTLVNKDELRGSGLLKGRNQVSTFDTEFHILDVKDTLRETLDFWNKSLKNGVFGLQEEVLRIADWFEKSKKEKDQIQSFILSWIGFNGLCNLYSEVIDPNSNYNEAQKFEKMLDTLIEQIECENIVKSKNKKIHEIFEFSIHSENGKTNYSDLLKKEIEKTNKDYKKIIKLITRCVYGVRKQVFHEAPRPSDVVKRAIIAKQLIEPISYSCLKNITKIQSA
jgi:hypothetical protein